MHASLIWSGVSKSGSPAAKLQTSSPAACRAFARASTASVGEGETLRVQVDKGGGGLLIDKRPRRKAPFAKSKPADGLAISRYSTLAKKNRREKTAALSQGSEPA